MVFYAGSALSFGKCVAEMTTKRQVPAVNWLRQYLEQAQMRPADLARALNTSRQNIARIMSDEKLSREWAEVIAPVLKRSPIELMYGPSFASTALPVAGAPVSIPVRGEAAAGVWREMDWENDNHPPVPAIPGRYPHEAQFAYKVVGPSVERLGIRDGDFVICVPLELARSIPLNGDVVVVERHRDGVVELSCKEVQRTPSAIELWPRSNDARFQEPLRLPLGDSMADDGLTTYKIAGLVIGRYTPMA